jgi:uncharacterized membrane protein
VLRAEDYRVVFIVMGLIGVLLFAFPTLSLAVHLPGGEKFSELWVLGPGLMAEDYPFNVKADENYLVYLGVGNHIGSSAYYVVYVKFGNQTDALPNDTDAAPSPLLPLYEYRLILHDNENWTAPLNFSFSGVTFSGNTSTVKALTMNNVTFDVESSSLWNEESQGCFYRLFAELWVCDVDSNAVLYSNRFVSLTLNQTLVT